MHGSLSLDGPFTLLTYVELHLCDAVGFGRNAATSGVDLLTVSRSGRSASDYFA